MSLLPTKTQRRQVTPFKSVFCCLMSSLRLLTRLRVWKSLHQQEKWARRSKNKQKQTQTKQKRSRRRNNFSRSRLNSNPSSTLSSAAVSRLVIETARNQSLKRVRSKSKRLDPQSQSKRALFRLAASSVLFFRSLCTESKTSASLGSTRAQSSKSKTIYLNST